MSEVQSSDKTNNNELEHDMASSLSCAASLSASVSSLDSVSTSGTASRLPKPSGIKPPSRIGRLCGGQHKPSVPTSPTKANSPDDSVRKLTDDLSRHRLTDSSTILTEDTDSFIIGQRVWVSGNKPGHIAYIGETQFAPGDWAGIALDEAIGKNDGSVGGIRYFQCEPKKGVFSRLTRLTRFPLEGMGSGETYTASTPSPVGNGVRRSPISPTGSTKGLLKSPMSIGGSNTSLASAHSHVVDYKIGDRVIIKSSQGSKVGTVKYIGTTEFANGEWVGVELDDPRGKNDGSVNGKRYFECRPNFGLFAPVSKVSKSPSRIKPGNCQVHPGGQGGLPPSGIKRANSKESITSNLSMTSAASGVRRVRLGVTSLAPRKSPIKTSTTTTISTRTALQELLKEKQQHIEQLLRERDLEIAEVTKAASRADDAEQKLAVLNAEFEKYRADYEREKRKNEDLQFRLDEASITKDDIEVTNADNVTKLKDLEEQLVKERDKCDKLEIEANKLFEAEEELIKAREDIKVLKEQVEVSRNKELALQGDSASTAVLISSLQKEVDQYKSDLSEKEEIIKVLKQEITTNAMEMNKKLEDMSKKKTELETLCNSKDTEITIIKKELEQANFLTKEKIDTIDRITTEKLATETDLEKQIEKLKMDLSSKILDLENATESSKSKTVEVTKLSTDVESLGNQLNKTVTEYEEKIKNFSNQILERNNQFEEINISNNQHLDQIKTLRNELETLKKSSDDNLQILKTYTQTLEEKENKLSQVTQDLQQKDEELTKLQESQNNLKNEYEIKITEIDHLKSEIENIRTDYQNTFNVKNTELEKTMNDIKEKELLIQNLQTELQTTKVDLESVTNNLLQYQNNLSTVEEGLKAERDGIKESLKAKIVELEDSKAEFTNNLAQREKLVEDIRSELAKIVEERTKLQQEFDSFKANQDITLNDLKVNHAKELTEREEKLTLLSSDVGTKSEEIVKLTTASKQLEEYNGKLASEIEKLRKELETKSKSLDNESEVISKLKEQIALLTKDKEEQLVKSSELEELKKDLEHKKASLEADLDSKIKEITLMNNNLLEKDTQLTNTETELKSAKENLESAANDLKQYQLNLSDNEGRLEKEKMEIRARLESQSAEFEAIKKDLGTKIELTEANLAEANKIITHKNEEVVKLNQQIIAIKAEKETFIKESTESHKKKYEDLEIKVSDLLTEIENKNSKITELASTKDELEASKRKHVQELEKLQIDLETAHKQNMNESETITKLNEDIKHLSITNEESLKQLTETQNQLKEVSLQKDQLTSESQLLSTTSNAAQTKVAELYKEVDESNKIHQTLKNEFESKTQKLESTVQELQVSNKQLQDILEKQAAEHETKLNAHIESEKQLKNLIASNNDDKLRDLQQILDAMMDKLAEKETLLDLQSNEVTRLKEELNKAQAKGSVNGAATVANISAEPNAAKTTNTKTDYQQLLEEKLFAESQIQFLNSIIVDMQKKNEEQKARIEILEMGYNSAAADELASLGFKSEFKQPAPRIYCDICEEFDLHETEDCPTQGEDEQVLPRHSDKPKEKPPPRPYCELCGEFGHDTADCTEDQEF